MGKIIKRIDDETSLPIKIVVPVIATILSAALWLNNSLVELRHSQRNMLGIYEFADWRNQFANRNRNLDVPMVILMNHRSEFERTNNIEKQHE